LLSANFIPRISDEPALFTPVDWTSVLKLSHLFGFASMRALAIKRLLPLTSPVDKIVLGLEYGIKDWLPQAYIDLCEADLLPSVDDSRRLGFEVFANIARAREELRRSNLMQVDDRTAIIYRAFDLPSPPKLHHAPGHKQGTTIALRQPVHKVAPKRPPPIAPIRVVDLKPIYQEFGRHWQTTVDRSPIETNGYEHVETMPQQK
jgi:hypothetical protein